MPKSADARAKSLKAQYGRLNALLLGRLHFAAHVRRPWPDATRDAALECWEDAAQPPELWWSKVWGDVLPRAQEKAAEILKWPDATLIAAAPTAHELFARVLSCLPVGRELRVLTTESEPRATLRQLARLEEDGASVERIFAEPYGTFADRLFSALKGADHDLIVLSQVFSDTGVRIPDEILVAVAERAPRGAIVLIDAGHAFGELPIDLSKASERAFVLAGGGRGAPAGEGAAFLAVPQSCPLRPIDTGGLADPDGLSRVVSAPVGYATGGARFMGGVFDPAGLYRWNTLWAWRREQRMSVREGDAYVRALQRRFVLRLAEKPRGPLRAELLTSLNLAEVGHFLSLKHPDAPRLAHFLRDELGVLVDSFGEHLRFGFGLHLDESDVDELFKRLDTVGG
jgi:selenocysteine lyase/cysteine desulfurase